MQVCAAEPVERRLDDRAVDSAGRRRRRTDAAGRVIRVRRQPEPDARLVLFFRSTERARQVSVDDEREHAGRERIERAGVADARRAERPPHPRHDVVRCGPRRLVDHENAVQRISHFLRSRRGGSEIRGQDPGSGSTSSGVWVLRISRALDPHPGSRIRLGLRLRPRLQPFPRSRRRATVEDAAADALERRVDGEARRRSCGRRRQTRSRRGAHPRRTSTAC